MAAGYGWLLWANSQRHAPLSVPMSSGVLARMEPVGVPTWWRGGEMPTYSDEEARAVFDRDMAEVYAHYQRMAEKQRPAVERAIANLTGQPQADDAETG